MAKVAKLMRKIQIQRALLRYLCVVNGERGARSFVSRDLAAGFSYAHQPEALDKRLEKVSSPAKDFCVPHPCSEAPGSLPPLAAAHRASRP